MGQFHYQTVQHKHAGMLCLYLRTWSTKIKGLPALKHRFEVYDTNTAQLLERCHGFHPIARGRLSIQLQNR